MSLDFGDIIHAADTEPEVLPVQSPGDGAGDAGFAHAGRTVETEDLTVGAALQLTDGDKLCRGGKATRLVQTSNEMSLGTIIPHKGSQERILFAW